MDIISMKSRIGIVLMVDARLLFNNQFIFRNENKIFLSLFFPICVRDLVPALAGNYLVSSILGRGRCGVVCQCL